MTWSRAKRAIVSSVVGLIAAGTTPIVIERHIEARQYLIVHEPWSDVGSATPKSALQSLAWALTHDKFDRAQALIQWDEKGATDEAAAKLQRQIALMTMLAPALKDIESFRILTIKRIKKTDDFLVVMEKDFKNGAIAPGVDFKRGPVCGIISFRVARR